VRAFAAATILLIASACATAPEREAEVPDDVSATPTDAGASPKPSARTSASKVPGAPDFTLRTLDGGTFTLSDHLGELPVVLNFWAPW
jgi:hypothetical protein